MENPFSFGNPINNPSKFIGRRQEIDQILSRLHSSAHESTSVIGERRIGKTSLLQYLSNPDVLKSYGMDNSQYCPVYIDFQGLTNITPNRFWQRVFTKFGLTITDESLKEDVSNLYKKENLDLFDLEDIFDLFRSKDIHMLLFMDEFETITQNPNFDEDFFGGLRSLAIHSNLSLIPATRNELVDLCHSDVIKSSPFFNIFATVILRPFNKDEFLYLFDTYIPKTELEMTSSDKNFIYKLSGGYPFFTQIAGYYYFKCKTQSNLEQDVFNKITSEFEVQAVPHFESFWNHCSESEKITLFSILILQSQTSKTKSESTIENATSIHPFAKQDIQKLLKRGLVIIEDDLISIFSSSFIKWISKEITATPTDEQGNITVEEWLKTKGNEKLLPAKKVLPMFKKKYWSSIGSVLKDLTIDVATATAVEMIKISIKG